jgi:CARDB
VAFLDEEDQRVAAPEGPERPRREYGGPERRRQQYLLRRLIAVGVGLGFVILLVLGVRGCLEARSDRGLRDYTQDIGTIMQESEQRGSDFFDTIESPDNTSLSLQNRINSLRGASESLYDRAQKIGVPGQMDDAQAAAVLSLRLRRDALDTISQNVTGAAARTETADAITAIQEKMGSLYASDILWTQVAAPEIEGVLESEGVDGQDLPAGNFMPDDALDWLDQTRIAEVFGGLTGADVAAGTHGLGLLETTIGDTTLSPDSATTVPDDSREIDVQVQNQGESDEAGVTVVVTINGQELQDTIDLNAGESGSVRLPIETLPQPGTETTVEVLVQPVPGEAVADNNEATYTVIFGSTTG